MLRRQNSDLCIVRWLLARTLIVAELLLSYPAVSEAADWNVASGDWSTPANWVGAEPTSTVIANITNGGTANVTQSGETCVSLVLGNTNTGTVQMTGGSLSVSNYSYIGYYGTGTFTQSAGTHAVANDMNVGYTTGISGSYTLSNTGQVSAANEYVGFWGYGTFTQTGGVNTVYGTLGLGHVINATGTYLLSNTAQLSAHDESIGTWGTGTFTQTGGTNTIANNLYIADSGAATYALSGASQLSAANEYVGYWDTGKFTQTGGTNSVSNNLYVGTYQSLGTYNHSAGATTVANAFYLGYYPGADGSYNLSGTAQLSAKYEYIGNGDDFDSQAFQQSGGTNTANYLSIAQYAQYTLSSGTLNINGGLENQGTLNLSNGAAAIVASNSIVNLGQNGSVLNAKSASLTIGPNSLVIVTSSFNPSSVFGTFVNHGILHTLGTPLSMSDTDSFAGIGHVDDHVNCPGTITATPGVFINLNGGLTVSGNGSVNLGTGYLRVSDSTSGISGGSLTVQDQYVGYSGAGVFTQSAGINTIANNLYLGYSGASATYSLIGNAQLSANYEYVGYSSSSIALMQQTAGTNTAAYISIGSKGRYVLSSGVLNISNGGINNQGSLDLANAPAVINDSGNSLINLARPGSLLANTHAASLTVGTNSLLILPAGIDPNSAFANFSNSGIVHSAGTTLALSPGQSFSGIGYIDDPVVCQGTITAAPGGFIQLNNGLIVSGNGSVTLGTADLRINDPGSGLSGGSLATNNQFLGYTGAGTFTHSAGTNIVSNTLYLGYSLGDSGTYNLSGTGTLNALNEHVGYSGSGNFTQQGGANTVGTAIYLAHDSFSDGTYNLSGGTFNAASAYVGYAGTGTFIQSDTSSASVSNLYLGYNANSNGTYNLSDAGTLNCSTEYIGYSGRGTFVQSGGTHTVSTLTFAYNASSIGVYYLTGGTLALHGLVKSSTSGSVAFNFGGGTLLANGAFTSNLPLTLTGVNGNAKIDTAGYAVTLSGALTGAGGLNKNGLGTLTLSAGNTFVGPVIFNGGLISASSLNNLGSGTLLNFNGGGLQFSGVYDPSARTMTFQSGGATLDTQSYTIALANAVGNGGNGTFTKRGSGKLTLNAGNNYDGETIIAAGTLALGASGAISNSPLIDVQSNATLDVSAKNASGGFSLASAQTLMGAGRLIGNVTALSGSHIAPGNSAGTLTITGNLTLNSGALLDFELANTAASDKISMSSYTLSINNLDFSAFDFTALSGFGIGTYTLIDAKTISGNLESNLSGPIGSYLGTLSKSNNDLILIVAVPEPGTWILLATACLGLFVGKRMGGWRLRD